MVVEVVQAAMFAQAKVQSVSDLKEACPQKQRAVPRLEKVWADRVVPVVFSWVEVPMGPVPWVVETEPAYEIQCWGHWLHCRNLPLATGRVVPSAAFCALEEQSFARLLRLWGPHFEIGKSWHCFEQFRAEGPWEMGHVAPVVTGIRSHLA